MSIPRASEFFIVGISGTTLSEKERSFLEKNPVGGIILFKRNIESLEQVIDLNRAIIEANHHVPLLSVDQEGGRVARLRGICTDIMPYQAMATAFAEDPHLAYRLGAMQARELVALGFNMDFAPVCDILTNPANHVIGDRAFSSSATTVADLASRFIKGMQGAGLAACAKHFPGHGDTLLDSHFALPILDHNLEQLLNRELIPFRTAIDAQVAAIMTAHIVAKPIDALPATLSTILISNLLRNQLGFLGVVISDDLDMKAIADNFSLAEIVEKGFLASVDMFIIGNNFDKALAAMEILQQLIDTNEEAKVVAQKAKDRVDNLRSRFLGKPKAPDLLSAQNIIRSVPHLELANSCG